MNVQNAILEISAQYKGLEGFDSSMLLDVLRRVLVTRSFISDENSNSDYLYNIMLKETNSFSTRFFGTKEVFSSIYYLLSDIEEREIIEFISAVREACFKFNTSNAILKLFEKRMTDETKTCFIPESEQYSPVLFDLLKKHSDIDFFLSSKDEQIIELYKYAYESSSNVKILNLDIYSNEFMSQRFDLICAVPIFGMHITNDDELFFTKDSEFIALQNLLLHMNLDGELAIVLPGRFTFGTGRIELLRKYIRENYAIREMSSLPSGVFHAMGIRTNYFVFADGKTDEVEVKRYDAKPMGLRRVQRNRLCEEFVEDDSTLVFADEIEELDNWNIDFFFNKDDEDIQDFRNSEVKKCLLGEHAMVMRGKAIPSSLFSDGGNIGVINIADITNLGIEYENIEKFSEDENRLQRYLLHDGDVLLSARGTLVKVAVFRTQKIPCIASANIIVIRPDEKLNGTYLKLFLESSVGTKMLKSLQRGQLIVNLNFSDITALEIPFPPIEKQRQIELNYIFQLTAYQDATRMAEISWSLNKQSIMNSLY